MRRARSPIVVARVVIMAAAVAGSAVPASGQAGGATSRGGTITGHVVTLDTKQPLADVRVLALGTNAAASTAQDGRYTLTNVRSGTIEVQALRMGYAALKKTVTVTAGGTVTADFELAEAIVQLQDVVTTATGQQRKVELGNNIVTLGDVSTKLEQTPVTAMSELFVGK